MIYADYLSRCSPTTGSTIELEEAIHMIEISPGKLESLKQATQHDTELSALKEQVTIGWPDQARQVPALVRPYWSMRDHIGIENGLLFKGDRVIIPKDMQKDILDRIHLGHQGIVKCQLRAKGSVFWRNITKDIEQVVKQCSACMENSSSNHKEPLIPHEIPPAPWHTLASDLFELDGHHYILLADAYSKMPFVRHLPKQTSSGVITFLKNIFSTQGVPTKLFTDNGPQYASREFADFASEWDFIHITSSPHYPQSNGFIERMVGTVKSTLEKAQQTNVDPQMALLCLRSTPVDNQLPSPAELLYGRKIRANLPLHSNTMDDSNQNHLLERQQRMKEQYDSSSGTELTKLLPGMPVATQSMRTKKWEPATVISKCEEPRSYVVKTADGSTYRRNRKHLKEIPGPPSSTSSPITPTRPKQVTFLDKPTIHILPDESKTACDKVPGSPDNSRQRHTPRVIQKPQRLIEQC